MTRRALLIVMMLLTVTVLTVQTASARTVLFDAGHGERFKITDNGPLQLTNFAAIVRASGADVATLDKPITDAALAGVDGLVISGAFKELKQEEIEAVMRFIERGGKLAVMLHIAPPLGSLLDRLQIQYTNGVILETENMIDNQPLNFRAKRLAPHRVLQGVKEFSLYGVWGLVNNNHSARIIAATSPKAWIDIYGDHVQRPDNTASFGVVIAGEAGKGAFLVFGDDAIFQNKFLDESNTKLAANLAAWL
jgi:hypothetical protein